MAQPAGPYTPGDKSDVIKAAANLAPVMAITFGATSAQQEVLKQELEKQVERVVDGRMFLLSIPLETRSQLNLRMTDLELTPYCVRILLRVVSQSNLTVSKLCQPELLNAALIEAIAAEQASQPLSVTWSNAPFTSASGCELWTAPDKRSYAEAGQAAFALIIKGPLQILEADEFEDKVSDQQEAIRARATKATISVQSYVQDPGLPRCFPLIKAEIESATNDLLALGACLDDPRVIGIKEMGRMITVISEAMSRGSNLSDFGDLISSNMPLMMSATSVTNLEELEQLGETIKTNKFTQLLDRVHTLPTDEMQREFTNRTTNGHSLVKLLTKYASEIPESQLISYSYVEHVGSSSSCAPSPCFVVLNKMVDDLIRPASLRLGVWPLPDFNFQYQFKEAEVKRTTIEDAGIKVTTELVLKQLDEILQSVEAIQPTTDGWLLQRDPAQDKYCLLYKFVCLLSKTPSLTISKPFDISVLLHFLFQQVAVHQLLKESDSLPPLLVKALQPHKFGVEELPQDESIDEIFLRDAAYQPIAQRFRVLYRKIAAEFQQLCADISALRFTQDAQRALTPSQDRLKYLVLGIGFSGLLFGKPSFGSLSSRLDDARMAFVCSDRLRDDPLMKILLLFLCNRMQAINRHLKASDGVEEKNEGASSAMAVQSSLAKELGDRDLIEFQLDVPPLSSAARSMHLYIAMRVMQRVLLHTDKVDKSVVQTWCKELESVKLAPVDSMLQKKLRTYAKFFLKFSRSVAQSSTLSPPTKLSPVEVQHLVHQLVVPDDDGHTRWVSLCVESALSAAGFSCCIPIQLWAQSASVIQNESASMNTRDFQIVGPCRRWCQLFAPAHVLWGLLLRPLDKKTLEESRGSNHIQGLIMLTIDLISKTFLAPMTVF